MAVLFLLVLLAYQSVCTLQDLTKPDFSNPSLRENTLYFTEGDGERLQICLWDLDKATQLTLNVDITPESKKDYFILNSTVTIIGRGCSIDPLLKIKDPDKEFSPQRTFTLKVTSAAADQDIGDLEVAMVISDDDGVSIGFEEYYYPVGDGLVTIAINASSAVDISVKLCCEYPSGNNCDVDCEGCPEAKTVTFVHGDSWTQAIDVTTSALDCHLKKLKPVDVGLVLGREHTWLKPHDVLILEHEIEGLTTKPLMEADLTQIDVLEKEIKELKTTIATMNDTLNEMQTLNDTLWWLIANITGSEPPSSEAPEPTKTSSEILKAPELTSKPTPTPTPKAITPISAPTSAPGTSISLAVGVAGFVVFLIVAVAAYALYHNRKKLGSCLDARPPKQGGGRGGRAGRKRRYERLPQTMEAALHAE